MTGITAAFAGVGILAGGFIAEATYEGITGDKSDAVFAIGSAAGSFVGGIAGNAVYRAYDANLTKTSYGKSSGKAKKYSDYQWYENEVDVTKKASRSKNKISPNSNVIESHVVYKKDPVTGKITNYKVYEVNPHNPTGFDEVIGYDAIGSPHINPITLEELMPHVHDKTAPGKVRTPLLDEIPE